jgi:hypothetical protein
LLGLLLRCLGGGRDEVEHRRGKERKGGRVTRTRRIPVPHPRVRDSRKIPAGSVFN